MGRGMNITSRIASLLFVAALAPACALEEADPDFATTEEALWQISAEYYADGWSSGEGQSLSAWESVHCTSYGFDPSNDTVALVTGVTAWRERIGNLDSFVARVEIECGDYDENLSAHRLEQTGVTADELLYSGGYRNLSGTSAVIDPKLPIGLRLAVSSSGAHVKDLAILTGTTQQSAATQRWFVSGYGAPVSAGWALGNTSNTTTKNVMCPDQMVLSRIETKNDTRNGKLRDVAIYCVEVGDAP